MRYSSAFFARLPTGGDTGADEESTLRICSNHCEKQGLSVRAGLIIHGKTLFSHRCGTKQSARFQADIHFAVRICHGRVFLTGTMGEGCDNPSTHHRDVAYNISKDISICLSVIEFHVSLLQKQELV